MRRPFAVLPLVVGLALVASCGDQPAPDGSVTRIVVAEPDWQGARAIGHVPAAIMEERLGFEVELVSVTSAEAPLDAMARGDGKGEYWRGPPDWNSTRIQLIKAQSYGFAQNFEAPALTDDEFTTQLEADYEQGKAALFYCWTPAWNHAAFDLRRLEEPPFNGYATASKKDDPRYNPDGCWDMIQPDEDEAWLTKSRILCASPDAKVDVAYSGMLRERAPAAARFLHQVALSPEMVNGWNLLLVEYDLDPAEMAKEWIAQNPDIVDGWLAGL